MPPRKRKSEGAKAAAKAAANKLAREERQMRETEEAAEARRAAHAAEMRDRRAREGEDATAARRREDSQRRARARQDATPEQVEQRRAEDAGRHVRARQDATPEEAEQRRADNADRHAVVREQEDQETRDERRALDADRHANARVLQTPQAAAAHRVQAAAHMAEVRQVQTPERAVHNRLQRVLRARTVNFDVPEEGAAHAAGAAAADGAAAPGQPGAAAAPVAAPVARPATLEELFDATIAGLRLKECDKCHRSVMRVDGKLAPTCANNECHKKFSATNFMDPGEVPPELQGLTYIEQQLIARVHPVVSVYKVRGGQYGYSGNIINFPQDVQQLASALPHRLADLSSVITVRTQGAEGQVDFKVRAGYVRRALVWLKANNRNYRDIQISEENLNDLPADGDVFAQVQGIDERPPAAAAQPAPAAPGAAAAPPAPAPAPAGGPAEGPQQEETEAGIHVTCMPLVRPVHNGDQVEATVADWPTIGHQAVNEFTTAGYLSMAFPTLLCHGTADLRSGRPTKVNVAEYFKYLMEYSDRRFACHPTFRFFALNSMMRWNALTNGRVFVRNNPQYRDMTAADLRRALQTNRRNVLKQALYHGNKLHGTRQFWHARCGELLDMVDQLGIPTLFLTLSAADLHWEDLFRLLAPGEDVNAMTDARRAKLLSENPLIADTFFTVRATHFIKHTYKLKYDLVDHWFRFEYQHRGSAHVHAILWHNNAPDVSNLQGASQEHLDAVIRYFDGLVSTMNPGKDLPPADVHPCRKKFSQVDEAIRGRDLGELLNRVQRHKCSNGYCQRVDKATGQPVCRFKFPFQEEPITRLFENDKGLWELVTARNDSLLNKYMEWVIALWRANMDATPIVSLGFILRYIAKYTAKGEPRSQPCAELVKAVLEASGEDDSARSVIQKLLMKTVSERDYSAQEVCHILTGQPLYDSSRSFHVVSLNKNPWVPLREENPRRDDGEADDPPPGMAEAGEEGAAAAAHVGGEAEGQAEGDQNGGEGDDAADATFPAFVLKYQARNDPRVNDLTLFQVAKGWSWSRGRWVQARREAIVRVFPRVKLTGNDDRDEAYYRVQVLLHTAWRTEAEAKGPGTWKEAFEHHGLVPEVALENALQEAAADAAAEDDLFEEPEPEEQDEEGMEEWMAVARRGPHGVVEQVELGRREMDLANDWHASSQAYGDHAALRDFVSRNRATANLEPEEEVVVDDVVYTAEQQKLIDLVQTQIDSVKAGDAPPGPPVVRRVIIQGKAGCGKSTVIKKCVAMAREQLGPKSVKIMTPTAAAATVLGMGCTTIHSLCKIFPRQQFKPLEGATLRKFQDDMEPVNFIFIDEFSMIGCKLLGWLEQRLREAKPECDDAFSNFFVYLCGDVRQLPPVCDPPLYATTGDTADVHRGRLVYQAFEKSIVLTVSQRQADATFRDALDRLSVGTSTEEDYNRFSSRFRLNVPAAEREQFNDAMHVYTTRGEVAAHNTTKLVELDQPVARIAARHNNAKAKAASADCAQGLEPVVYLAKGSRVMLRSNLWLAAGLVNGATGTVVDIIYSPDKSPPDDLPVAVMVRFDKYSGPTMPDGTVPIPTQVRGWDDNKGTHCTREQFPLALAWAITVHKAQGLTVERAVVSVGQRDFQVGLIYVAMSRVKSWEGLLLDPEFSLNRMTDIRKCPGFIAREAGVRNILRKRIL